MHFDLVREHARAARDRRAIATGFANHRSGFAGDGRFVHGSDAFDHFAVPGNEFARSYQNEIAGTQNCARDGLDRAIALQAARGSFRFSLAQRLCLRLAASFGHRFGEIGEQNREPQPESDLQAEPDPGRHGGARS